MMKTKGGIDFVPFTARSVISLINVTSYIILVL